MRYEVKKITKMIDEVTNYFLFNYRCKTKIEVIPEKSGYTINFFFEGLELEEKEMKKLLEIMGSGRDTSLANYYWQLTGEIENDNELYLIAMMCDDVKIEQQKKGLSIMLSRKSLDVKK